MVINKQTKKPSKSLLLGASCAVILTAGFIITNAYAGALNATNTAKAPAATITDPAAQAEQALNAQESLQAQSADETTADNTATPPTLAAPESAAAPTTSAAPSSPTQMGPTGEQQQPAAASLPSGVMAPPSLDNATEPLDINSNNIIPPVTDATPGMDLPIEPEKTPEELEAEMREDAFKAASGSLMPLRPDEIRRIKELADENKLAVETPILPAPKPESTFTQISLDPGQAPVELKTAMGNVTTLSILDATGQPWPIQDISWAGNFEVLQPEQGSNILRITPMSEFAFGNVSMRLIGLTPPVIFTLKTDRRSVQVRADVQIPQNGPNATPAPIQAAPSITTAAGDIGMTQILEGVPPAEANKMTISGVDGRTTAYEVGGLTFLRTPYTLLSPAWNASVRSADGTNVYAMNFAPVLLLSDKGQLRKARLQKMDMNDE